MNVEQRLRDAMHAASDRVEPDEVASLATVRVRARRARRRRRVLLATTTAVVVAVGAAGLSRLGGDERMVGVAGRPPTTNTTFAGPQTDPATATTTTVGTGTAPTPEPSVSPASPPVASTTVPLPGPDVVSPDRALWPGPGQPSFDDGLSAARSFVEQFIGLVDAPLGPLRSEGADVATVDVFAITETGAAGNVASTLRVERVDGHWFVTGAVADDVVIESPAAQEEVTAPLRVAGRARGYEGTVIVEVRESFSPAGQPTLGTAITIAGCCGEPAPFDARVPLSVPSGPTGVVVASTDTGLEGAWGSFTAIPVRFAAVAAAPGEVTVVHTFFTQLVGGSAAGLVAVERRIPATTGVLRSSLVALLDGPSDDEAGAGLVSWLPRDAGGTLAGVDIDAGRAIVRLVRLAATAPTPPADDVIAELNATVFQFANVHAVRYELDGSCDGFDAWLARGCEFQRPDASSPVPSTSPSG